MEVIPRENEVTETVENTDPNIKVEEIKAEIEIKNQ
jgi:hypothetical protein